MIIKRRQKSFAGSGKIGADSTNNQGADSTNNQGDPEINKSIQALSQLTPQKTATLANSLDKVSGDPMSVVRPLIR